MENASGVKKRAIIVDDQISVRQMVGMILAQGGEYELVGEADTGFEGMQIFQRFKPELVVTELALPELNGAEMILRMREDRRLARILIYTGSHSAALIRLALEARPHGFVHKTDSLDTLREALRAVHRGYGYLTPFATRLLDEEDRPGNGVALTRRERSVLQMIAEGMKTKQMAARLSISPKTAEFYRRQLMQKLGIHDIASLTRYAMNCGMVGPEELSPAFRGVKSP